MGIKIFHFLSNHYRIGGKKIIKPHCCTVFIGDTIIDMEFTEKDYDLLWVMHKVVEEEMKLNIKLQLN